MRGSVSSEHGMIGGTISVIQGTGGGVYTGGDLRLHFGLSWTAWFQVSSSCLDNDLGGSLDGADALADLKKGGEYLTSVLAGVFPPFPLLGVVLLIVKAQEPKKTPK